MKRYKRVIETSPYNSFNFIKDNFWRKNCLFFLRQTTSFDIPLYKITVYEILLFHPAFLLKLNIYHCRRLDRRSSS